MSEFSGFALAVGSVVGVRRFDVDARGRLHSVYVDHVWAGTDVVAHCDVGGDHPVPWPDCSCGLYSYSSAAAVKRAATRRQLLAVVENCGRVIVGTKGYRAQRSRLLALVAAPPRVRRWGLTDLILRMDDSTALVVVFPLLVLTVVNVDVIVYLPHRFAAARILCGVLELFLLFFFYRLIDLDPDDPSVRNGRVTLSMLERSYPGTPIYRSLDAALAAHPLTPAPTEVGRGDPSG